MEPQYFTVDEVNRILPRLEPMLLELREAHREMLTLERELGQTTRQKSSTYGFHVTQENQARSLHDRAESAVDRFRRLAQAIADLSAEVKDPDQGLIDFRGLRDGREVYLCWRLGEADCVWWHELHTGFQGRQPLD